MTYKTHIITGVTTAILISQSIESVPQRLGFIGAAFIGSVLPDIDTRHSYITRFTRFHLPIKHRGYTHSIIGVLLVALLFIPFKVNSITTGLMWGYISHILADAFTVSGVYPFYPSTRFRLRFAKVRTNKLSEGVFLGVVISCFIGYYAMYFRQ